MALALGLTRGRVRGSAIPGQRMYYKPTLGKVIFRPPNVVRRSSAVLKINQILHNLRGKDEHPSKKCGLPTGRRPLKEFLPCLSEQFKLIIKPLPLGELSASYKKLLEAKKVFVAGEKERPTPPPAPAVPA